MISIQTNVNSLVAQQNLSVTSAFQAKTIQQLTSGYRINSSSDDAAGLAVANKYRNSVAELTQGVANGNDGVASLQIMDSGMSNISQMMDRLKTLAMQSASDSFSGGATGRATLNTEFQTDIGEIDRQAQSIGLNTGGTFAKSLSIYLGAGSGSQSASNATVTVDLSKATVDSSSLGLAGYQAVRAAVTGDTVNLPSNYDLSDSNTTTNVGAMIAIGGKIAYSFNGAGFGATSATAGGVQVTVDTSATTITNTATLVAALNTAIQSAASATGNAAQAFKAAGITASIHTDANGKQQLAFSSSNSAFQVIASGTAAADQELSNALLGNLASAGAPTGATLNSAGSDLIAQGTFELGTAGSTGTSGIHANTSSAVTTAALVGTQTVNISVSDASGTGHGIAISFDSTGSATSGVQGTNTADYVKFINTQLQASNDTSLQGITAVANATSGKVNFISTEKNFSVTVAAASTSGGMTTTASTAAIQVGSGGTADISTVAGAQAAVTAISQAVSALGTAQAAIGRGQNALNYGISLANSQITNFSAAESQIRDANVAQQAANLSKAQTLSQAAIAAMAQANSAPQGVLSLLRG